MQSFRLECLFVRIACYTASLLICGPNSPLSAQREASPYTGLLQNSPFGLGVAVPAIEPMVEFRGFVREGDIYLFSLASRDASNRISSMWVKLDEPYADYIVRSFDDDTNTLHVERRGQRRSLRLKSSQVLLSEGLAPATGEKVQHMAIAIEVGRHHGPRQDVPEIEDLDGP